MSLIAGKAAAGAGLVNCNMMLQLFAIEAGSRLINCGLVRSCFLDRRTISTADQPATI